MGDLEPGLAALRGFLPLTEENVEAFLSRVEEITRDGDRRTVAPILLMADEGCPLGGVTDRMLSLLDRVPAEEFVAELLAVLPRLLTESPGIAENEVKKLLWTPACRVALAAEVVGIGGLEQAALRSVLGRIRTAALQPAIAELEQQLGCESVDPGEDPAV